MLVNCWATHAVALLSFSSLARSDTSPPPSPAEASFAPSTTLRLSLLHRAYGQSTWHPRGYLELSPASNIAKAVPMAGAWDQLDWSASPSAEKAEYQLALAGAKDDQGEWQDVTSIIVPRCRLAHPSGDKFEEVLTVYLGDDLNQPTLAGFRYWTKQNVCNNQAQQPDGVIYGGEGLVRVELGHALIPEPVRFPDAKEEAPVTVGVDGQIVAPVPEKSFIQKYWIYLVAGLLVIILSGGGEEASAK